MRLSRWSIGRDGRGSGPMRPTPSGMAKLAVGLAASAGLGWLAIRGLDWGLVAENLAGASPALVALAVSIFMLASWLRALRWRMLFVGQDISVSRLFIVQHEGLGLSNLMPVRVASEVTQLAVLPLRDGMRAATALATLAMERVLDVANTLLLGVLFFLVPEMRPFGVYVAASIGFTVLAIVLVRLFAWSTQTVAFLKRVPFLTALGLAVREMERERARLLGSLLVSVGYWVMVGVSAWVVAAAFDLPLSPVTATLLVMATTISRVPGSGVRGRGSGERETTASSLAGKQQAREKEDNGGQGKDGPAGAIAQGGNGR